MAVTLPPLARERPPLPPIEPNDLTLGELVDQAAQSTPDLPPFATVGTEVGLDQQPPADWPYADVGTPDEPTYGTIWQPDKPPEWTPRFQGDVPPGTPTGNAVTRFLTEPSITPVAPGYRTDAEGFGTYSDIPEAPSRLDRAGNLGEIILNNPVVNAVTTTPALQTGKSLVKAVQGFAEAERLAKQGATTVAGKLVGATADEAFALSPVASVVPPAPLPVDFRAIQPGLSKQEQFVNNIRGIFRKPQTEEWATPIMEERARNARTVNSQAAAVAAEADARASDVFTVDKQGRITELASPEFPNGPTIQDVAARFPEYEPVLTPEQQGAMAWLRDTTAPYRTQWDEVQQAAGDLADRKARELNSRADIQEGGFYLPRGRAAEEGADAPIKVSAGRTTTGGGGGFKQAATFDSMAQGIDNGYEYAPFGESMHAYIKQIGADIVNRRTANEFLDLRDVAGGRIAQTAADRVDPKLREDVSKLASSIVGQRVTAVRQAARAKYADVVGEAGGRLADRAEKLADAAEKRIWASLTTQRTDEVVGAMERELFILRREALKAGRRERLGYKRASDTFNTFKQTIADLDRKQAALFDLRGRLKRAQEIAASTPRDKNKIGLVQLQGYDFPDAIANAANMVLDSEKPLQGRGAFIARVNNTLNTIYRGTTSTGDNSAVLVQGSLGWFNDFEASKKALSVNVKAAVDPQAYGAFLKDFNAQAKAKGLPDVIQWTQGGLHQGGPGELVTGSTGITDKVTEGIKSLPVLKQADRMFSTYGDTLRLQWASNQVEDMVKAGKQVTPADLDAIAASVNRMTGYATQGFGNALGDFLLYAPRWYQARLETIVGAGRSLLPGATKEHELARVGLLNDLAKGTALTVAANTALGNETDIRPVVPDGHGGWKYNTNFMSIRFNGRDWNVFGPYSLLWGLVLTLGTGHGEQGLRQFSSSGPMKVGWDLVAGENAIGKRTRDTPEQFVRYLADTFQPFSTADVGASIAGTAESLAAGDMGGAAKDVVTGVLQGSGMKNSELSGADVRAGIVTEMFANNPDYPEYGPNVTYLDLAGVDRKKVNDDIRLKSRYEEMNRENTGEPISDQQLATQATAKMAVAREGEERQLRTYIDSGAQVANPKGFKDKVQKYSENLWLKSQTIYDVPTQAALDRLRLKGDTVPMLDVLADEYRNVPLPEDPQTLEQDYRAWDKGREAVLQKAAALGYSAERVKGQKSKAGDSQVQKVLDEYHAAQETLRPYWETPDTVAASNPAFTAIVERHKAAEQAGDVREVKKIEDGFLWDAYQKAIAREKDRLRKTDEIDLAGLAWGYWKLPASKAGKALQKAALKKAA